MTEYAKCVVCGGKVGQGIETFETKCDVCGKDITTNYVCENGHHVCNQCKINECAKEIKEICLNSKSTDPIEIAFKLMDSPCFKNIKGCRYQVIPAVALYTANRNHGGKFKNFEKTLDNVIHLATLCPSSLCKMGGVCGMTISTGKTLTEYLPKNDPEKTEAMIKRHGEMSVSAVENESNHGNRDCCNRNVIASILAGVKFSSDYLWVDMDLPERILCRYFDGNSECSREKCRFYLGYRVRKQKD